MKKNIVRYENRETCKFAYVYDYTLDTSKEWKEKGWVLTGTYYNFLVFRMDI